MTVVLDADGAPVSVTATAGWPDGRTAGTIETVLDTWRVDDEWWRQLISRDYMEVILEGGKRVVLFKDRISAEWFVQLP